MSRSVISNNQNPSRMHIFQCPEKSQRDGTSGAEHSDPPWTRNEVAAIMRKQLFHRRWHFRTSGSDSANLLGGTGALSGRAGRHQSILYAEPSSNLKESQFVRNLKILDRGAPKPQMPDCCRGGLSSAGLVETSIHLEVAEAVCHGTVARCFNLKPECFAN